jgi:hypothetical protein
MSENQNIRLKVLPTTFMLEAENYKFDVHVTVHRDKFLIIKPTRCTNFSKVLFWNETLHVLDSSSVHHQFSSVHTAVGISHTGLLTANLCVQCETPDDGHRNCLKHVEFHSKIKLLRN